MIQITEDVSRADLLLKSWGEILEAESIEPIKDYKKKVIIAQLLENTRDALSQDRKTLHEAAPANSGVYPAGANIGTWDPILISLVRRAMPNLIAYDVCGVQPMTGPTGLIFAMKSRYTAQDSTEALFNEADTAFSGTGTHSGSDPNSGTDTTGTGMTTATAEALGSGSPAADFQEMAFSIEKVTVTAKSRALKAEYSLELAQDLKAIHGLDAETELANILSAEILTEINREIIRTLYYIAKPGAAYGVQTPGTFDVSVDSNGRWSVERFKGLLFQAEREANAIAKETRRGRGNFILASSDVASALAMSGVLDFAPALSTNLTVDDTGNTFVGVLNGRYRVYIDPYFGGSANNSELMVVGYKGTTPYDAGFFYCPYVPLQMVRAVGENTFQPKIGFKTRYGLVGNPFWGNTAGALTINNNSYYRRVKVTNLM